MFTLVERTPLSLRLGTVVAAFLMFASAARAQPPARSHSHAVTAASHGGARPLMRRALIGMPGKEVVVTTIEVAPGESSPPHRHYAQVFVYMLQGRMIMQVKGGPRMTLGPGQTFYESPSDIHTVGANASPTKPAKFLVFMIKDKGRPGTVLVGAQRAHRAH